VLRGKGLTDAPRNTEKWIRILGGGTYSSLYRYNWRTIVQSTYEANPVVYSCINYIIRTMCQAKVGVFNQDGDLIPDHWATKMLTNPQPQITSYEFKAHLITDLMLSGAYLARKIPGGFRKYAGLQRIAPDMYTPLEPTEEQKSNGMTVGGFRLSLSNGSVEIAHPDEFVYIRYISPLSTVTGQSPLLAAFGQVDTDNYATEHVKTVLNNKGKNPSTVLETELNVTPEEALAIESRWREKYGGDNRGGIGVLGQGAKVHELGMTMVELDLDALRRTPQVSICNVFGVPPELIGVVAGLEQSSYNNKAEAHKAFYLDTLVPMQAMLEEEFQLGLLPDSDNELLRFDNDQIPAYQMIQSVAKELSLREAQAGFVTIDEHRATLGLPPVPSGGGNYFLRSFSQMEVPFGALPKPVEVATVPPEEGKSCKCGHHHKTDIRRKKTGIDPRKLQGLARSRLLMEQQLEPKVLKEIQSELESQAVEVFKAISATTKAETVTRETADAIMNQVTLLENDWAGRIQKQGVIWMGDIVKLSADSAVQYVFELSTQISNDRARDYIKTYSYRFARKISMVSADQVRGVILEAQDGLWSVPELRDKLKTVFSGWNDARAKMIAETETHRAVNSGDVLGYREAGVVEKQWLATELDACEFCQELDGQTVGIDDTWLDVGSEVVSAGGNVFRNTYESVEAADLHPNCKCRVVPVIPDRYLED
jgi:HK97 family phage portal protein